MYKWWEKELDAFISEVIEQSLTKPYDLGRFVKTVSSMFYNGVVAKAQEFQKGSKKNIVTVSAPPSFIKQNDGVVCSH